MERGADYYIKNFLTNSMPYSSVAVGKQDKDDSQKLKMSLTKVLNPSWDTESFKGLMYDLGCMGYGYLDPEEVREKLDQRTAEIKGDEEHMKKDFADYTVIMKMQPPQDSKIKKPAVHFSNVVAIIVALALIFMVLHSIIMKFCLAGRLTCATLQKLIYIQFSWHVNKR